MASVLDLIKHYQHAIEKYPNDEKNILKCIDKLFHLGVTVQHLQETGVGRTVNALRKEPGDVGQAARALVYKWKLMVASEESDQEGDQNNDTAKYNGHDDADSEDSHRSKNKQEKKLSDRSSRNDNTHGHMNGDHHSSKRKYHSSEEDEPDVKKSKLSQPKENGYKVKREPESRSERSNSESESEDDSSDSESDSDASQSSEEEKVTPTKVKEEKKDKHHTSRKESSSHNHSYHKSENTSERDKKVTEKHSKHSDNSRLTESSKERNHSSHRHKSSSESKDKDSSREYKDRKDKHSENKDKENRSSEKDRSSHKDKHSEKEKKVKHEESIKHNSSEKQKTDKEKSSSKHRSEKDRSAEKEKSSEKEKRHKEESSKKHSNSDKHKSSHSEKIKSNIEKSSSKTEKHSSSSEKERLKEKERSDKQKQKSSSDQVIKDKHEKKERSENKEKHSSSSKEKSSSSKEKDSKGEKRHSSSSDGTSKEVSKKSKSDRSESSSRKDKHKSSSSKSSNKANDVPKKKSHTSSNDSDDGIDCESGASFAEALGMVSPVKPKKKSSKETQSPNSSFNGDLSPANLLAPTAKLAPLPNIEISALPEISPNYKPRPPPKFLPHFEEMDLSTVMSSKNQRTKVFSGNKVLGKIPSLYEMCVHVLQEHIDALEYTGGVPYEILKPVVDRASPQQLFMLEHYNPYLMDDTDHLWQGFCGKHFRNKKRMEMETWREMYMRCQEEQEIKLKSLTENIKIAQEAKKAPIKQTKMAYVDTVVKPPRNIARKQAQHGTAFAATASPAARVAALASAPNVLKGGRPAPVATASSPFIKPKKAPLMQKALQFMRGRKR
ncbi:unnamed protein product [Colias eurytheme]|nr:unnamed protein product [Colias eurytheme]